MSFVKTGDAQPILHVVKSDDELEEKRKKAASEYEQAAKKIKEDGNKFESTTESKSN
jgi:hypothetical protein